MKNDTCIFIGKILISHRLEVSVQLTLLFVPDRGTSEILRIRCFFYSWQNTGWKHWFRAERIADDFQEVII